MGPDHSEERVKKVFDSVVSQLQKDGYLDVNEKYPGFVKARRKALRKLQKAIDKVVWLQEQADF